MLRSGRYLNGNGVEDEAVSGIGVSQRYVKQGLDALASRHALLKGFLSSRRLPERGWGEQSVSLLLAELAAMDSNNFDGNAGVGEREGRIAVGMVARRHFHLAHGMGRSGEVAAEQPKAAGSSLIVKMANIAATDALRVAGCLAEKKKVLLLPLATGMALTLVLLALRRTRPRARYVLLPRIDQKTCLKVASTCGYELIVVENELVGDEVRTCLASVAAAIERVGPEYVACVQSTTSCFAPRAADDVVALAKLCERHGIPHVINNAYGVQARGLCEAVVAASRKGRVDCVVASTDKNFLVPVGGAMLIGEAQFLDQVSGTYPGRASLSPILDVLITLLMLGRRGWEEKLQERATLHCHMHRELAAVAAEEGERVLHTPGNPISMALTLSTLNSGEGETSFFGSMLFSRLVSGTRAVSCGAVVEVEGGGGALEGFGSHYAGYPVPYLAAAAAIGGSIEEVDKFITRLRGCFRDYRKRRLREGLSKLTTT